MVLMMGGGDDEWAVVAGSSKEAEMRGNEYQYKPTLPVPYRLQAN
jgi:hypothetical protein